ncbi:MAG: DUF2062 domain-containing protein [Planctomycetes bacterium]|nr:DUF2062 domain-containing protein [Planctomycetota bacterium]
MPFRAGWNRARGWFIHLLHLDDSAHSIAMGAALGMFIAFTPTIGIQMMLIFFVTSIFRANRVAGVPMAWVTNPATIVPVFWFNLYIGTLVVGGSDSMLADFEAAARNVVAHDLPWWDLVKQWWDVVMEVAVPLWVGSVIVGLVVGALTYAIMYYLITTYRRAHQRHLAAKEAARAAAGDGPPAGQAPADPGDRPS